jgi:hypothetical protein
MHAQPFNFRTSTRINIPYPSTPHRLCTPRILTLHNTPAARRPCAHLPRCCLIQRRHVHGRRQGAGGEFCVEARAKEDGTAAGAFGFEVGGGEGGEEGGGWKNGFVSENEWMERRAEGRTKGSGAMEMEVKRND